MTTSPSVPPPGADVLQVPLTWGPVTGTPAAANHVALQATDDGVVLLTLGFAGPPILNGTPDEQLAQMREIRGVEIRPVAQFILPARLIVQLAEIFGSAADAMAAQLISEQTGPDPSPQSRPA